MGPIEDRQRRRGDELLEAAMLREAAVVERQRNVGPDAQRGAEGPGDRELPGRVGERPRCSGAGPGRGGQLWTTTTRRGR